MSQYTALIKNFLDAGYICKFFHEELTSSGILILRHDIDFDINYAYMIAKEESNLGVKSTFFFLLRSKAYNFYEKDSFKKIKKIMEMGHEVSIHFDPTLYENIEEGFEVERNLFESIFDTKVRHISIHRPSNYFLNNPNEICGVEHTYSPKYFEEIKYFADSRGSFRYGHPIDSQEFQNRSTIQLLTHPVWWVTKESNPIDKLKCYLNEKSKDLEDYVSENCIPYKQYIEEKQ